MVGFLPNIGESGSRLKICWLDKISMCESVPCGWIQEETKQFSRAFGIWQTLASYFSSYYYSKITRNSAFIQGWILGLIAVSDLTLAQLE